MLEAPFFLHTPSDRIIGDEEKRTIIENMEGKAEVIFDNSEGYDRDTDIVISTRCVGNRDVAGMEVIIREDIGVGCHTIRTIHQGHQDFLPSQ